MPKLDPRPWPERHGRVERRPRYDEIAGEREYPLPGCLAVFHARREQRENRVVGLMSRRFTASAKALAEGAAGQRIVSMEADAVVAEAFEQFRFNRTRNRVVQSLVDARPYPSTARGYFGCLRHLPCAEITYAELLEQAFVMKFS